MRLWLPSLRGGRTPPCRTRDEADVRCRLRRMKGLSHAAGSGAVASWGLMLLRGLTSILFGVIALALRLRSEQKAPRGQARPAAT